MPRILHITPTFNYTCGRSYYHHVTFEYLKSYGCYNYLFSKEGIALERLELLGNNYTINENIGSQNPLTIYSLLKQINKVVNEKQINIIHTYSRATELLSFLYKSLFNKKIVIVNTVLSLIGKRYFIEYKSDRLIAISLCVESQLLNKFRVPKNRINLIYNFAEPYSGKYFPKPFNKKEFKILSVGRYHREKNFETLLKALKYLNNESITLDLIGSGELRSEYQKYIDKNKLNVRLIQPVNDLTPYFLNCDICVLPSLVDPLPTFMIQSGFYKKPFIGSDVDGIGETINDGFNGLLFTKGDSVKLADKIIKYYQDTSLMSRCSDNLYELVSGKHLPVDNVKKIYELYNSLLPK